MALKTIVNTGGTWNSPSTWSPSGVPAAGDDVISIATSGPLTVTANASCKSLILTGYTSTLTVNSGVTLTISGNTTFSSGMSVSGTGTLSIIETSTLTSAGKTWTGSLNFGGALKLYTLADTWNVDGNLSISATNNVGINGNSINVNGGYNTSSVSTMVITGGTDINMIGSGSITTTTASSTQLNFTIDTLGSYSISTFSFASSLTSKTFKYIKGTITGTKTLFLKGGSFMTLDCSGLTWNTVQYSAGNATTTLVSDLNVASSIIWSINSNNTLQVVGAKNINFSGTNFTLFSLNTTSLSGDTTINFYGSPNIISSVTSTVYLPFVFNCGSNTVTFPANGNVTYRSPITFNSLGSLVSTSNVLRLGNGSSVINNTTGLTFNTISIDGATSFSGTQGFNMNTLTNAVTNSSLGIIPSNNYNINNGINLRGTAAGPMNLSSTTISTQSILTLNNTSGTTQSIAHVNVRDIDSSSGATIWNYKGTLTNNLNWNSLTSVTRNPNLSSST